MDAFAAANPVNLVDPTGTIPRSGGDGCKYLYKVYYETDTGDILGIDKLAEWCPEETGGPDLDGGDGGGSKGSPSNPGHIPGSAANEDPRNWAKCVASNALQNRRLTRSYIGADRDLRWAFRGARTLLGGMYVASDGAPGLVGLAAKSITNPVSKTPSYIAKGLRVGARVAGRSAIRGAAIASAKAGAVAYGGFEAGVAIGSLLSAAWGCSAGG